ncbi:MAG: DUF1501 domain-containing protein [Mariniblastus sp.]|jgi:hypothetical protein|nr:DUF1501 domain-containing protein [Mariniblastus sp.]
MSELHVENPGPILNTRREVLRTSALGFGQLALASLLREDALGNTASDGSLNPRKPLFTPRAKRVIFLFMLGGPSHLDTFDYKPRLDREHGKPLPFPKARIKFDGTGNLLRSPWKFRHYGESGALVSDLFPHVAQHADDLCIVRSLHGTNVAHGAAILKLHTGSDTFIRPSMGSWILYGLGTENQNLPGFITICPTLGYGGVKNWSSAFLPAPFQGIPLANSTIPPDQARIRYLENHRVPRSLQRLQLDMLRDISRDQLHQTQPNLALEGRIDSFELAFRMQTQMPAIQDISDETAATQKLYGLDDQVTANFGRQCLLARRFAEQGVRFIQVTHSPPATWDQHYELREGHETNAQQVDRPIAGLLKDLKGRGLLEDTLVIWGGEFGRTPTIQGNYGKRAGRDHNPTGFTIWLAGGGVKGGIRYGATDDYGYHALQDKVHLHDLHATILHLLGLDHEQLTYRYAGREFRLTDVHGNVVQDILA